VGVGGSGDGVTFVLSASRISEGFLESVEQLAGEPVEVVLLPELRRLGPAGLLRRLRSLSGSCLVVSEDPSAEVLIPVLEGLASITRARSVDVVRSDLSSERISRQQGLAALGGLAASAVEGRYALRAAKRELDVLTHTPRMDATASGSHVLYLNANLWFGVKSGGSVAHVAGVVNALSEIGREVTLATAVDPVGVTQAVNVVRLEVPRRLTLPAESNYYRFGRSVPDQLAGVGRPGFVYQRHSLGSYAGVLVARRDGVPLVLEYNGSEVWVARNWSRRLAYEDLGLAAEDASLRHAQLIVTVSRVLAEELEARGVDARRIVWHPNGVDADGFDPARFTADERATLRERYGIPADAVLVTFVGTFGEWHGVEVLARAVRVMAVEQGNRVEGARLHFMLVGDGLKMSEVRQELAGLDRIVTLTGIVPQSDAPLHLAASDILVSPHIPNADGSPFFGSPTKLFEYMAAGKPIVASDLDQIGEVLADGAAVLVEPGSVESLVRALRELADDPERRATLGRTARERVLARYTWHHHVRAILERLG
jgi:glycosyltransferase involved in cell wall biosynthesis